MQLKKIVVGKWYETTLGLGQCSRVGGTHPPSVKIRIVAPLSRGDQYLTPRDVLREIPAPTTERGWS